MLYKIFLPPKEFGGKCICFVILRDLSIAYLAYVSKERGNATKYCEVYPPAWRCTRIVYVACQKRRDASKTRRARICRREFTVRK